MKEAKFLKNAEAVVRSKPGLGEEKGGERSPERRRRGERSIRRRRKRGRRRGGGGGRRQEKEKKASLNPPLQNFTITSEFPRRTGFLPYCGIHGHWIFKGLHHPGIIYGLQDCKSFLYDLGAWLVSFGTRYMIQLSLRSSPFPILDAFLSTVVQSSHVKLESHKGRAGGFSKVI